MAFRARNLAPRIKGVKSDDPSIELLEDCQAAFDEFVLFIQDRRASGVTYGKLRIHTLLRAVTGTYWWTECPEGLRSLIKVWQSDVKEWCEVTWNLLPKLEKEIRKEEASKSKKPKK